MDKANTIDKREAAYNKAYQEAVREGAKSMSDLDIAIQQKMDKMGFTRQDKPSHSEFD